MLIDAAALPEDTLVESDICIIGAGAAGITLAQEFVDQPYQVCLLESGGLDFDEATQSLSDGQNIGTSYYPLKEVYARYFGGTTNLWGGWSRPFDEIDFEDRPWMPYSGWPIARADLVPYYKRAQKVCHLGPFEYDFSNWEEAFGQLQHRQLPFLGDQLITYLWQIIPQAYLRFGRVYKTELEQARNIRAYLHANVIEIEANDTAQAVTQLHAASLDGKKFRVSAKVFILAVGGIENPRLLLASNKVQSTGLGNQHDLVGRFFMEHPYLMSGKLRLSSPAPLYTQSNVRVNEVLMGTALALSKAVQAQEQVLNFSTRIIPVREEWLDAFNRLRLRNQQTKVHKAFPTLHEGHGLRGVAPVIEDLGKVIANLDRIAAKASAKLLKKQSRLEQSNLCDTHLIAEQAPNPDSRVKLSAERDQLGLNRVQLDWRLSPIDKYTIQRSQQIIAEAFERSGLGQLQIELTDDNATWQSLRASYHHMGTTRMSTNPKAGVVDQNCQVHGINNLYVAGSSVFPTGGLSNPTLTIVALAIRLADQIKDQIRPAVTQGLETTSI